MALIVEDRILETSTTTGTGALALGGAVAGYRAFSAVCSVSDTCYYAIEAVDSNGNPSGEWETGLGTYSGANTLTRTTVDRSSNSNAAVDFSAGSKRVFLDANRAYLATLGGGLSAASTSETRTGTSTTKAVTPGGLFGAAQLVTLTDGATITPDFSAGVNFTVTLGGNRTLANPSNSKQQSGVIIVKQDATGSRTLSFGANYKFPGASKTLSTTANAVDMISYIVQADGTILCTLSKAFA